TDVADFETIFEEVVGAGDWRQVTVDLSAYAGESVYIAFNHAEVTDMFAMNIDDVTVTGADSRDFTGAYNVYKNGVLVGENITEQNFQLTALLVGSEYTVGVTAIHDAGESAAAETTFIFLGGEQILPVDDLAVYENSGELSWNEPAPAIDYSDDFDAYTAGDYLAEVSDMWTTWAQNPGGSDDAMISDAVANSGTNSVHIEGTSDLVLPLGNKTSGTYEFSMMMYLEPGNGGYYNIQHYQTPGEEWGAEFYFGDDGNGEYSAGYPEAQPFTHPTGEWFEVKNVIDLDAAEGTFLVDGTEVASWDFGLTAQGEPGINQLGGINIYSGAISGQTPNFYFDDVSIFKVTDRPVLSYDVYLDDTLVGNTTETTYMLEELTNGEEYTAGVVAIFESGDSEMTEITFTYSGTFSEGDLVLTTALNGNYPNPFNPTTTISFSLAETANVDLKVYNAKGQVVKTLVAGEMNADNHTVVWNGDDNNGKSVSSGVYFYRMSTKGFSSTHKMMLIK
ncbi:MAG: FlgD immunoglobulin-like domain containing protein, partial [Candidatus Cloacimonadales bacterium]